MAGYAAKSRGLPHLRQRCRFALRLGIGFNFSYKSLIVDNLQYDKAMQLNTSFPARWVALLTLFLAAGADSQATQDSLSIRAIAEVESTRVEGGHDVVKLVAADRVVPGDHVIYTLEVRNTGATAVNFPVITHPVPEHMRYVADSAVGPGAEVTYSVDGGRLFDRTENLQVIGDDAHPRAAVVADYTHIRWRLKNSLKANSVAFVRFRAVVK
jgi:uncharacterized repeat protein (TIGR01451 family)